MSYALFEKNKFLKYKYNIKKLLYSEAIYSFIILALIPIIYLSFNNNFFMYLFFINSIIALLALVIINKVLKSE